jgi:tetratricopeptide (TPR) repeat protein
MPLAFNYRGNAENPGGKRLDSWKEIAAYLGRGERTVKRWEAGRGLPAHRVPGKGRPTVYAYTAELDEWLKSSEGWELASTPETFPEDSPEFAAHEESILHAGSTGEAAVKQSAEPEAASESPAASRVDSETSFKVHSRPSSVADSSADRHKWMRAVAAILLVCAAGAVLRIAVLRRAGVPLAATPAEFFARRAAASNGKGPMVVSAAEQDLAHGLYLKGRYEWNQRTPDSLNRALDCFTQAIVHDPGYAQAYVGLAETYDLLREYSTMPDGEAFSRGIAAARRAVELDDSLADAHRALAFAEMYGTWDFAAAERDFHRAIELNPKDPETRRWYANAIGVSGRFGESLDQMDKALALDPTSHATLADKGLMLHLAGRTSEGTELLKEVERSAPEFRSPHDYLMRISLERRDYPAFLAEGEKDAESTNDPILKHIIATARAGYERNGERGLLRDLYSSQKEYYLRGKLLGTELAKTCVLMGKKQEALQLLEEAYNRRESAVLECLSQPDLLSLENEPRFRELVSKINFPGVSLDAPSSTLAGVTGRPLHAATVVR